MRIEGAESTLLFTGAGQIMRVTLTRGSDSPVLVRVAGAGVSTPQAVLATTRVAEVPVAVAAPHGPGSALPVTVIAESAPERGQHERGFQGVAPQGQHERGFQGVAPQGQHERAELATTLTVAEPGWTIWLVSHFHYDPVWWNTQGQFTQSRLLLPGEDGMLPEVRTAFELVRLHLDAALADPDYKFVLAELDYLKPYFDTHPADRADLRALLAQGRIELVGGNYNEPNTNLTCAESTIRNAIYGIGHQRDVLGGDPASAWMLDAFGFDPGYPGLMAAAGLTSSAWARGPFHQWGPWRTVGGNDRMQFATEFEWLSPDGQGLLTSYMANHYGAGWGLHQAADLAGAQAEALAQLALLAPVAATRNVLLPVGADHVIPARWATALARDFAARYVWPRCVTALPREFFAAVRAEADERQIWLTPQTRDMNPVYPGKDVSYIDTKQAQRAAETAVLDGERLATLAWLAGADYPAVSLDKAWRLLAYGAHHDAITGTESDQVYLDLLAGWREAYERGGAARRKAAAHLAALADTRQAPGARPVVVFNTLSWERAGLARVKLGFAEHETPWLALTDGAGAPVPFLAEDVRRHGDGSLAEVTITFRAGNVPALGYRAYWAGTQGHDPGEQGWADIGGCTIENETFRVEADPERGGVLARITDQRSGAELLQGPGNELVLQDEYDYHPRWGEGPWLLSPKGPGTGSAGSAASVRAQRCPIGARLLASFTLGGLRVTQEAILWDGANRVEFATHVDGSIGQDALLRVRFPAAVPGGLPVYQCATAVVGRPFGSPDADVAQHPFTLDSPAAEWFGVGATAAVRTGRSSWPIGVAEVILPTTVPEALRGPVRTLVAALAAKGVTATCASADGPRYGALDLDSNLPDCRIVLGGAEASTWTAQFVRSLAPGSAAVLVRALARSRQASHGRHARVWVPAAFSRDEVFGPGADVRGERDLPVLIVAGPDLATAITALVDDLAGPGIAAELGGAPVDPPWAGRSVALLNRGTPSGLVAPDGTLHITLMRASSAWPSGVWIDGERRTAPDGSSFAWQHWSHTFRYALMAGTGDWRQAEFSFAGQEYNHDLLCCQTGVHQGPLPPAASLCQVTGAMLSALKPHGNPLASGRPGQPDRDDGVTVRLRDAQGPGRPPGTAAQVRLFTGLDRAAVTDLLEATDGEPVPVADGAATVRVPAAGQVTLALTVPPVTRAPGPARAAGPGGGPPEPVQPVFTRYWLHGKGPAPAGNLPVAVHLSPGRVALPAPGQPGDTSQPGPTTTLRLTVACGPEPACGAVTLDVPPGLAVDAPPLRRSPGGATPRNPPPLRRSPGGATPRNPPPLRYDLPGGGYACWDLGVTAQPTATPGRYYLAARVIDDLGQVLEDAALVTVGEPPAPDLNLPLDELLPLLAADEQAGTAEIGLVLRPATLALAPGGAGEFTAELTNRTAAPIRGECQLISPLGTWLALDRWAQSFAISAGEAITLRYPVRLPGTTRPGSHWWALAKVMYFGRLAYTEAARIEVADGAA